MQEDGKRGAAAKESGDPIDSPATDGARLVGDVMTPLPARLALHHCVAAARELMYVAGFSFLVVVAPTTGKLLGIVLRRSLERECESSGHDPECCPLVRHVETDIDFCLEGETLGEVFGSAPTALAPREEQPRTPADRRRQAIPVIVVDQDKIPVGLLSRKRASEV